MRRELLVPKLGLTMTEGTLVEWLVKPGESFRSGQNIFVIESEKAATEIPAEADGVLLETTAEVGTTLVVGAVIGYWDDQAPAGDAARQADSRPEGVRTIATPLARRLARERGIDLATLTGSGPRGRIRARDLPETQPGASASSQATAASGAPAPARTDASRAAKEGRIPQATTHGAPANDLRAATSTEQTIARRLVAAKQQIPHFYLAVEAEVSALQKLRAELNAAQSDQRFTINHFVLAAVGRALAQMPEVNRVWTDDGILSLPAADVGMAVHTERGLVAPVLRDLGRQPLAQVATAAAAAASRAQAGRLGAAEMAGGAITVSNAGMHGVTYMASIINPGQAMILGVGSVRGVFRPDEHDEPRLRRELGMVLSADHRILDGVTALKFLERVVSLLERPLCLLV